MTDAAGGERKIVGSAQRRRRGAVLQHGSLLAAASPAAPGLPGLAELCGLDESAVRAVVEDAAVRFGRLLEADAGSPPPNADGGEGAD